jgi:hypothetical protein
MPPGSRKRFVGVVADGDIQIAADHGPRMVHLKGRRAVRPALVVITLSWVVGCGQSTTTRNAFPTSLFDSGWREVAPTAPDSVKRSIRPVRLRMGHDDIAPPYRALRLQHSDETNWPTLF